jgi:hypothetical protein
MSKSLDQLGLKDEALPTGGGDLSDLPEFGSFTPPPPPGAYRFKLPADLSAIYDVFDTADKGQRVKAIFDKDHPLVITQSKNGTKNGEPFETRITNNERPRGKKGSGVVASDWDYLLRALGEKIKPTSNRGYIDTLKKFGGKEFGADLTYSWACSTERDIRVANPQGGAPQVVEGHKGCGEKFYEGDIQPAMKNADGTMPLQITCSCGALLRAFANLESFRP